MKHTSVYEKQPFWGAFLPWHVSFTIYSEDSCDEEMKRGIEAHDRGEFVVR